MHGLGTKMSPGSSKKVVKGCLMVWRPYVVQEEVVKRPICSLKAVFRAYSVYSAVSVIFSSRRNTWNSIRWPRFARKENFCEKPRPASQFAGFPSFSGHMLDSADKMAKEDTFHERTLFIMNALFGMYLRISELVKLTAGPQKWVILSVIWRETGGSGPSVKATRNARYLLVMTCWGH